jgi:hypothetical protein
VTTWSSGQNPFLFMTLRRIDDSPDGGGTSTVVVAARGDELRMVDCARKTYYNERISRSGANLIATRMDVTFVLLMYPQTMDLFRNQPGIVREEKLNGVKVRRLIVGDESCHLELVVDAATYMPIRFEHAARDRVGVIIRNVIELSDYRIASNPPPSSMFEINDIFAYPQKRFDPVGLYALPQAPTFEADMLDGKHFDMGKNAGKWIFVCFRATSARFCGVACMYLDRAGDIINKRGGVFVNVYPNVSDNASFDRNVVYSLSSSFRSDMVTRVYGISATCMPCLIVIDPSGRVSEMMIGYIPGVSERSLDELIDKNLPIAK